MSSRRDYRSDRSDRSSHRRDSSPRRRSRRSESPVPQRTEKELPPSFGRSDKRDVDDNLNVLQRMSNISGPLELLKDSISNGKELKIWTRNFKEIRGICTGKLLAFDKHWNLVIQGVEEVFLKKKKAKTPFLREIKSDEVIPDIPKRVPRTKRSAAASSEEKPSTVEPKVEVPDPVPVAPNEGEKDPFASEKDPSASEKDPSASEKDPSASEKEGPAGEPEKKKKKRKNRSRRSAVAADRQYTVLFVRGDNIVMIAYKDDES